jgi:hypothetical protein
VKRLLGRRISVLTKAATVPAITASAVVLGFFALRYLKRRGPSASAEAQQNASPSLLDTRDIPLATETGDYLVLDLEEIWASDNERPR